MQIFDVLELCKVLLHVLVEERLSLVDGLHLVFDVLYQILEPSFLLFRFLYILHLDPVYLDLLDKGLGCCMLG